MFLFYTFISIILLRFEEMLNICEAYYLENFGEPFLHSYEVLQVKCTGVFQKIEETFIGISYYENGCMKE